MVVKRDGKGWRADWRTERGVRKRRTFKLKSEAEAHETRMRERARTIRDGDAPPPAGDPDITLERFVNEILKPRRLAQGIAPGTSERDQSTLKHHVLPALGAMRVKAIHRPAAREWVLGLFLKESSRGKPLSNNSVHSALATLSVILAEAVIEGLIPVNPTTGLWREVRKGRAKKAKPRVKALTTDQARVFLEEAERSEPDAWPAFALMTMAGLRVGEAIAVTEEKLDLRGKKLLVDQQLTQFGGLRPPKGGEDGTVELAPQLVEILKALIGRQRANRVVTIDGGPFLLAPWLPEQPSGAQARSLYRRIFKAMKRVLTRTGSPSHFRPHALRHTYGSGLVSRGVSLAFVQQQMRHKSIKTTVDDYGSWLPVEQPGRLQAFVAELLSGGHLVDTLDTAESPKANAINVLQQP